MPMEKDAGPKALNFGARPAANNAITLTQDEQVEIILGDWSDRVRSIRAIGVKAEILFQDGSTGIITSKVLDEVDRVVSPEFYDLLTPQDVQKLEVARSEPLKVTPGAGFSGPHGLNLPQAISSDRPMVHSIGQPPKPLALQNRAPPTPPRAPSRDKIIGADPRSVAIITNAAAIDAATAALPLFRSRVQSFLDLKPLDWMTWGEVSVRPMVEAGARLAGLANQLSLAQAPKWADETRAAYQKGKVGFFDKKPAFYEQMLVNARDILIHVAHDIGPELTKLKDRLGSLKIDALVLQVCTDAVSDASHTQIASDRLRTLLTVMQNAGGTIATLEQTELVVTKQVGDVQQLLSGIIPTWATAQSKA